MSSHLFAPSYKPEPFWWERSPLCAEPEPALPTSADVVIIGTGAGGGVSAEILSAAGLKVILVEHQDLEVTVEKVKKHTVVTTLLVLEAEVLVV